MASGTNYSQEYGQAEKAYLESNFAQAAEIIDHLADKFPSDPNVLLLRGHIYCYGFENYDLAKQQYETVLNLSEQQDLLDFARGGIEQVEQLQQQADNPELGDHPALALKDTASHLTPLQDLELPEILDGEDIDETEESIAIDFPDEEAYEESFANDNFSNDESQSYEAELDNVVMDSDINHSFIPSVKDTYGNPFGDDEIGDSEDLSTIEEHDDNLEDSLVEFESELESEATIISEEISEIAEQPSVHTSSTFMVDSEDDDVELPDYSAEDFEISRNESENDYNDSSELEIDTVLTEPFSMGNESDYDMADLPQPDGLDYQDELEFDEIDSSFFDLEELEQGLPDTGLFDVVEEPSGGSTGVAPDLVDESSAFEPEEVALSEGNTPRTTSFAKATIEPQIEVKQGALANFINAPIRKKQLITAGAAGLISAIAVLTIGLISSTVGASNAQESVNKKVQNSLLLALVAGLSSAGTAAAVGNITAKHVTKASQNLQNQFDDVYQGNLNAKATVYSQDEFGQLSSGFNRMTRVILTTTQEAQRRAEETEQAKEDLQRQVIRLLDDVEGAARGDLTVQATVTADVLGAVADAFNLTIQSLREIVRQVKEAAEQVNKGSTDSELFARNQSSEALRMAEELAVTLNSVQMMTESIERGSRQCS